MTRSASTIAALPLGVLLPLVLAACSTTTPGGKTDSTLKASNIPSAIAVPGSSKLAFTLRASGLQNYECRAKTAAPGSYDWVFVSPEAALYDKSDSRVGRHYGDLTFEYGDDSKVAGSIVAEAPATEPASIAWLLLKGTPAPRTGVMSGVTYVQRVNTHGGVAPSDDCSASTAGTRKGVRYSADYLFYKG